MHPREKTQVLLVEDLIADGQLMLRALKAKNLAVEVYWVRDGAAALDFLFRTGEYVEDPPRKQLQLVLLDVKLPKVDGIEVLSKIKSSPALRSVPVVMLTSSMEKRDVAYSYASGANSYIVKPVDFDQLIDALSTTIAYWMQYNYWPKHE